MLARVQSYLLQGIDALPCEVEVDYDKFGGGGGQLDEKKLIAIVVGLPDASVKESIERVKTALLNSGFDQTGNGKLLVNLAPANVRKEGPAYDLPIALGMLMNAGVVRPPGMSARGATPQVTVKKKSFATPVGAPAASSTPHSSARLGEQMSEAVDDDDDVPSFAPKTFEPLDPREFLIAGELALDGRVRPIKGVIAMASLAKSLKLRGVIVPRDNAPEAAVVPGIEAIGVATIAELVGVLSGHIEAVPHPPLDVLGLLQSSSAEVDFADVRGQEAVKRAIVIAAAGSHNILMLGPAGTGKSMMAKALPGVLPALTPDEAIEVTRIYSAAGMMPTGQGLITVRPVRTPHHTASAAAIIGGGMIPRPGEISLAHHGVLFLDELPEFPRFVLETLRQPLEDHQVTIARSHAAVKFPASFMLVAAMNPTPKGDFARDEFSKRQQDQYLSRLSGPLIDRIDIHVEAPAVPWKQLSGGDPTMPKGTSSAQMRAQVLAARERQQSRQGAAPNARLSGRTLDKLAPLDEQCRALLGQAMTELGLSARAYDKVRRVARTIADIDGSEHVQPQHISEAVAYRLLDRKT